MGCEGVGSEAGAEVGGVGWSRRKEEEWEGREAGTGGGGGGATTAAAVEAEEELGTRLDGEVNGRPCWKAESWERC